MTIKEIANLNPSDYFYNLKDKLINYVIPLLTMK